MIATRTAASFGLVATAAVLLLTPAAGQQAPPTFRAGVLTVPIFTTVVDASGRLIPDLEEADFEIYDENKKQDISIFKTDIQPVSVVVMMDTSGSMTANYELLKNGAEKFVIRLMPDDRAQIGSFSDKIVLSGKFTSDRDDLVRYLHEEIDYGNPTRLWDAAYKAMDVLASEENRRVVLLFTDGEDSDSRNHDFGDVMRRAQAEDYMVYGIGFRSRVLGTITKPDPGLRKLANETGGGYFELKSGDELNSTFSRVADELHRQYVLGFSPKVLDGKIHRLNVVVKRQGMIARARKSYLAAPSK